MNYEWEDYRPPKPPKDPGPWLTWTLEQEHVIPYFVRMFLWMYFIPVLLFGLYLTPVGYLFQLLILDWFTWVQLKQKNSL